MTKKYLNIIVLFTIIIIGFFGIKFSSEWYFTNIGTGKDGGSITQNYFEEYDSSGFEFKSLSSEDLFAVPYYHISTGEECGKLDNDDIATVSGNSIKLQFKARGCTDSNYNHIRISPKLPFEYDFRTYRYKHNLIDSKPITPIGLDCIAYGNGSTVFDIEYSVRVKNTENEDAEVNLECTLENLPKGLYSINYIFDGSNDQSLIEIK